MRKQAVLGIVCNMYNKQSSGCCEWCYSMPNVPPSSIAIVSFSRSSSNVLYGGKSRRLKHVCDLDAVGRGEGGWEGKMSVNNSKR